MRKLILVSMVFLAAAGPALAQSFSSAPLAGVRAGADGPHLGPGSITHSLDTDTITPLNSVGCRDDAGHTDNSYLRRFVLADYGIVNQYDVASIDTAVEMASGPGTDQLLSVNLYMIPIGVPLLFGNLTLIGSSATGTANGDLYHVNFPVEGSVINPSTDDLVVELFTPDGRSDGNLLLVGSNSNGQTAPTYIAAADCGVVEPIDLAELGFPDMHWILVVHPVLAGPPCELAFGPFKVDRSESGVAVTYSIGVEHNSGPVRKSAYVELQDLAGNVVASKLAGIVDFEEGQRVRIRGTLRVPVDLVSGDYVFVVRLDGMKGFKERRSLVFIP